MRRFRQSLWILAVAVCTPVMALSNRVFVSSSGTDAGACPITAPCRTFSYAFSQGATAGEIIALETAGYGPVVIDKSVSIVAAPGVTAFIAGSSGAAVTLLTGDADRVTLRGLALKSSGAVQGIFFRAGSLFVENCLFDGFSIQSAISFIGDASSTDPRLSVAGSTFRNNYWGVYAEQNGAGHAYVTVANCSFESNQDGVDIRKNARGVVSDSVFVSNYVGASAESLDDTVTGELTLERSTFHSNDFGVLAGAGTVTQLSSVVRLANCTVTGNGTGILSFAGGRILSRISNGVVTNTIEGNTGDGAPDGTYNAK